MDTDDLAVINQAATPAPEYIDRYTIRWNDDEWIKVSSAIKRLRENREHEKQMKLNSFKDQ